MNKEDFRTSNNFYGIGILENKKDNSKIAKLANDEYQLISNCISFYIFKIIKGTGFNTYIYNY